MNTRGVAAEIRFLQGAEPVQQVAFALEMGQRQRFFGLQAGRTSSHPVCRVEKQRLRSTHACAPPECSKRSRI